MKINFTCFILLWSISFLLGQSGQLDPAFNLTGKVTTHIENYNVNTSALLIQDDGKILVCGNATSLTNAKDFVIARYSPDGSPDSTFNTTGKLILDFFGKIDYCYAMALQADGKILLTGIITNAASERKTGIVRLLENGSLDSLFGINGVYVNIADHNAENPQSVHYMDDGKIIVTGIINAGSGSPMCAVFKYNEDGSPDESFGDNGLATAEVPDSYNPSFGAIQEDGKIITGGFVLGNKTEIYLLRFLPDATIDSSFGSNGIVWTKYANEDHFGYSIYLQDDHKILMADGITHGGKRDFGILRYTADGLLDSTFGTNGKVVTAMSAGSNTAHAVSVQEDQKILLAGFLGTTPQHDFAIARYHSNGTLDTEFGIGGKVITDFGNDDLGFTMVIQPDDKIVVAGHTINNAGDNDFAIARYLSGLEINGTREPTEDFQNISLFPNPVMRESFLKYTLKEDQRITIRLYDLTGKLVQYFFNNVQRGTGDHVEKLIFSPAIQPGNYFLVMEGLTSCYGIPVMLNFNK